ncbi:MAG: hypothetical protein JXA99_10350 [Candidatus Lokiarchaeota archaeon]|nr:hypothetical protein [Candidatus Lokiarchaeota archaeon]
MIKKDFIFQNSQLNYSVLLTKIQIEKKENSLEKLFQIIEDLQNKYNNSIIQFFDDLYILNENHIYNSIYYTRKAYMNKFLISNKQSIELLLYFAAKRQIKNGITYFGIKKENIDSGIINFCIVSDKETLEKIYQEFSKVINFIELKQDYNEKSVDKYNRIKEFFDINEKQIKVILKTLDMKLDREKIEISNLNLLYNVLNELICEKMVLLSLEKTNS